MRGYHKCTHEQVIKLAALLYRARFGADDKHFSKFRSEKPRRESLNGVNAGFQAANHPSSISQSELYNSYSAKNTPPPSPSLPYPPAEKIKKEEEWLACLIHKLKHSDRAKDWCIQRKTFR